jgi:hypothetical protein
VDLLANTLRTAAGSLPSGGVLFSIVPHGPATMPGDFTARNALGQTVALETVGAVTLSFTDASTRRLPPHLTQANTSKSNVLLSNSAKVYSRRLLLYRLLAGRCLGRHAHTRRPRHTRHSHPSRHPRPRPGCRPGTSAARRSGSGHQEGDRHGPD